MRLHTNLLASILWTVVLITSGYGQESVYPTSTNVSARYALNSTTLAVGDTLVLTRTLVNHTSHDLTGLYFSDNLPSAFTVVSYSAEVNATSISVGQTSPLAGGVLPGYRYVTWLVDSPDTGEAFHRAIAPRDSLTLVIKIICGVPGSYGLPLHSTVCYTGSTGIFATSSPLTVTFRPPVDTTPPAAVIDLSDVRVYKEHQVVGRQSAPGVQPCRERDIAA